MYEDNISQKISRKQEVSKVANLHIYQFLKRSDKKLFLKN